MECASAATCSPAEVMPRPAIRALHFGLGDATAIDDVEVRWPSGATEHFPAPQIDHIVTLKEGQGAKH